MHKTYIECSKLGTVGFSVGNRWFLRWEPLASPLETIGFYVGNQWFLLKEPMEADRAPNG